MTHFNTDIPIMCLKAACPLPHVPIPFITVSSFVCTSPTLQQLSLFDDWKNIPNLFSQYNTIVTYHCPPSNQADTQKLLLPKKHLHAARPDLPDPYY